MSKNITFSFFPWWKSQVLLTSCDKQANSLIFHVSTSNILQCFHGAQHPAPSWGLQPEDRAGRLIHEGNWLWPPEAHGNSKALSVVNGSEKRLWPRQAHHHLIYGWRCKQTVSHVTSRDISIFMATVQVYFRNKFWKIRNKKSKWIYDTGDVVCDLPGRSCVLIPSGQG